MSQYDELDRLVPSRVAAAPEGLPFMFLFAGEVRAEAERIAKATGREEYRVFDGRLQALRKAGKLKHDSKRGWSLVSGGVR
jgi:hypothetical protein